MAKRSTIATVAFMAALSGLSLLPRPAQAQAASSTSPRVVPTFESMGLYWTPPADPGAASCAVQFRRQGESTWRDGLAMWYDARNRECRGSLVQLQPGTQYEIQFAMPGQPPIASTAAKTWSDDFPIARVVTVQGGAQQLNISESGTASGYVLYQAAPGAVLDAAGAATSNINVTGSHVIVRGFTLKGARQDAVRISQGSHDVVIEDNDISGWGRSRSGNLGVDRDAAVKAVCNSPSMERIVVQRNKIHNPRHTTNDWSSGHPLGPQGVDFDECGANHVIRHNDIGSTNGHWYNDGIGGGQNFSSIGFPYADTDIYGNSIENAYDDGIESEGANRNVRIWGNYINNTYTAVATTATGVGPVYIFRNVYDRNLGGNVGNVFSKSGSNSGLGNGRRYVFHNTLLQTGGANGAAYALGGSGSTQPVNNTFTRNNIWHIRDLDSTATYQVGTGNFFDNDMVPSGSMASGATNVIKGVPVYQTAISGLYELTAVSPGFDRAARIANFNDDYSGTAPDVGAQEAGKPVMKFGVAAGSVPARLPGSGPALAPVPPPAVASQPYSGSPIAVPATIEAENFDKGGEGVAYHDNVKGNAGGQYRAGEDVDIIVSTDAQGGGFAINNFETGEWMQYTVSVATAGQYTLALRASTGFADSGFHVEVDGKDISGPVVMPRTASWNDFQPVTTRAFALDAGTHVLKIVADRQYFNFNSFSLGAVAAPTPAPQPLSQPYFGMPVNVPATIEAENFDKGGQGLGYNDKASGNAGGQYRTGEDVDIVASPDSLGGAYVVNNFETGEWLAYSINVPAAGAYTVRLRAATSFTQSAFHVEIDGVNVSGSVIVPATQGFSNYQNVTTRAFTLTAGRHVMKIVADQQYFNLNSVSVVAAAAAQPPATPPAVPQPQPYTGSAVSVPATIQAENFDKGGEGVAYHDNVKGNAGAVYRTAEDVDLAASPEADGGYIVNNFETGEWLAYSIDAPTAGNYLIELRAATSFTQSAFHLEIDGRDVSGKVTVPSAGGWTRYGWVPTKTVALAAGRHVMKVYSDQQYFNLNAIRVSKVQ